MQDYTAVIERCQDTGLFVGYVSGFSGAHSQGETLEELHQNLSEVIAMLLEGGEPKLDSEFIRYSESAGSVSMAKLPVLKPQEVISRLEALDFVEVRQRGAHK